MVGSAILNLFFRCPTDRSPTSYRTVVHTICSFERIALPCFISLYGSLVNAPAGRVPPTFLRSGLLPNKNSRANTVDTAASSHQSPFLVFTGTKRGPGTARILESYAITFVRASPQTTPAPAPTASLHLPACNKLYRVERFTARLRSSDYHLVTGYFARNCLGAQDPFSRSSIPLPPSQI